MKPIVAITKAEQVRQAILEMIFAGTLTAGDRIVEARLASQLDVSQATVNAALQDLHNQGVVTKLLNRSTTVNLYTQVEIDNLFRVRLILEPEAAAAASAALTPEGVESLLTHVDGMRSAARAGSLSRFSLADYGFHQELYRIPNNSFLHQACQAIAAAPFAFILCGLTRPLPTDYLALAEDHAEVVRALEEGPRAAARITRDRIESWKRHSVRALETFAEKEIA